MSCGKKTEKKFFQSPQLVGPHPAGGPGRNSIPLDESVDIVDPLSHNVFLERVFKSSYR